MITTTRFAGKLLYLRNYTVTICLCLLFCTRSSFVKEDMAKTKFQPTPDIYWENDKYHYFAEDFSSKTGRILTREITPIIRDFLDGIWIFC